LEVIAHPCGLHHVKQCEMQLSFREIPARAKQHEHARASRLARHLQFESLSRNNRLRHVYGPTENWFGDSRPSGEQFLTSQSETVPLKNTTDHVLPIARFRRKMDPWLALVGAAGIEPATLGL